MAKFVERLKTVEAVQVAPAPADKPCPYKDNKGPHILVQGKPAYVGDWIVDGTTVMTDAEFQKAYAPVEAPNVIEPGNPEV